MAQPKPERISFNQVIRLVDQLPSKERDQLRLHLNFQCWDEQWNRIKKELAQKHIAQGLPSPTDDDIHIEIDARRSPEEWEMLKGEIQKGIDELDRGESIPAEQVLERLRLRADQRLKEWTANK